MNKLLTTKVLANLAILVTVFCWGVSFISIKIAVSEVPPLTMALIRFAIATAILLAIIKRVEPEARVEKADRNGMLLAGFLGITTYFFFENTGVKLTTASNASLIISLTPIMAIIMDVVIFKSKVAPLRLLGIVVSVVGSYLVVTANGQIDFSSTAFRGNLLMLGAMLSWVFYTGLNKSLQGKYSGIFLTTYQTLWGTIFLLPLSLLEYKHWHLFSLKAFGNIVFLAVCCSALGYFLYLYALSKLDVTLTTLYLNLVPIVAVVSGYLILQESILPIQLLGGAFIIVGILMVNFLKDRAVPEKELATHPQCKAKEV